MLWQGTQQISDQNNIFLQSYDKLNINRTLASSINQISEGVKNCIFFFFLILGQNNSFAGIRLKPWSHLVIY